MDSDLKALLERVEQLEADVIVHREHIRALVSLLPQSPINNGALVDAGQRVNAVGKQRPDKEALALQHANGRLNALGMPRIRQGA